MRAVVQRVSRADVTVAGEVTGAIGKGFMVLLGVGEGDTPRDADYVADKIANLRVFEDADGKMNLSLADVGGGVLLISQFTLYGDTRHGRRPSFIRAARPEAAVPLYERVKDALLGMGIMVQTGVFQTHMDVSLVNDGPVTLMIDSEKTI